MQSNTRTQRLGKLRQQVQGVQIAETVFNQFESESLGRPVPVLQQQQASKLLPAPAARDTLAAIWSVSSDGVSELRAFVAQWLADEGWDLTKPRIQEALRVHVPARGDGHDDNDDHAFAVAAAAAIKMVLFALGTPIPAVRPRLAGTGITADLRRMETTSARFRRPEHRIVGGKRFSSESSRFVAPRGDRSGRLHTLRQGPPPEWCTSPTAMLAAQQ